MNHVVQERARLAQVGGVAVQVGHRGGAALHLAVRVGALVRIALGAQRAFRALRAVLGERDQVVGDRHAPHLCAPAHSLGDAWAGAVTDSDLMCHIDACLRHFQPLLKNAAAIVRHEVALRPIENY